MGKYSDIDTMTMDDTLVSRNRTRSKPHAGSKGKKSSNKTPRRPVTPGKTKKTGHDQWMTALKKGRALTMANTYGRVSSPRHKTPTEFFVDTLRRTGVGLSSETNKSQSLTGLKGSREQTYPYMSTPHYLRQMMGTEKPGRPTADPTARHNAGTPNYKSPEEYYDEILSLRKQ